jgi:hypothetical protein
MRIKKHPVPKAIKALIVPGQNSNVFLVDYIIRRVGDKYLIRWAGFDAMFDTFEPTKNISPDLIRNFKNRVPGRHWQYHDSHTWNDFPKENQKKLNKIFDRQAFLCSIYVEELGVIDIDVHNMLYYTITDTEEYSLPIRYL